MTRNIYHIQIAGKISSVKIKNYHNHQTQVAFALLIEVGFCNDNDERYTEILEHSCIADDDLLNTIVYYEKVDCKVLIKGIYVKAYSVVLNQKVFNPFIKVTSLAPCK